MTDDRIAGTAKNAAGRLQEGYGRATDDPSHEVRGKMRQAEGAAQDTYGQAKEALADATRKAQDTAADARDVVRDMIEERPYTVAIAALAVGFILGRMGRSD
jgi:uncharacterized protein YjbJ (UPF0337 family)